MNPLHATSAAPDRVAVRVPLPVASDYTYKVPEGWSVPPGALVRVPVSGRELWAAAWGVITSYSIHYTKLYERSTVRLE